MLYREDRDVNCYHTVDDEVQNEEQHKSQLSTYTKYINSIEESHLLKFKYTCVLINLRIHFFNHNEIKNTQYPYFVPTSADPTPSPVKLRQLIQYYGVLIKQFIPQRMSGLIRWERTEHNTL